MLDGNAASFDVAIDIPDEIVPPGMRPHEAVYRVRAAVEAMAGVGWVSVDYSGLAPPDVPWIVLYQGGRATPLGQAGEFAMMVETTARRALS